MNPAVVTEAAHHRAGPFGRWAMVCLIMISLATAGCSQERDGASTTIRVGLYENAPKIHSDDSGAPSGLFVELLNTIAGKENWQLEYIPCRWSDCLMAVQQGDIDLMPDVAPSGRRRQFLDFHAIPVAQSWSQLYTPIKTAGITSLAELEGQRIAVLDNSVHESYLENHLDARNLNIELVGVDTMREAFRRAEVGQADAAVTNNFFGSRHASDYNLVETPIASNQTSLFFTTTQGRNTDIMNTLDRYLVKWKSDADSPYYSTLARTITPPAAASTPTWVTAIIGLGVVLILALGSVTYTLRGQALYHFREARDSRHRLHHLTHYDRRTGLPNRALLQQSLDQWIREADEQHDGFIVFLIDLDRFKTFNETLGVATGDEILSTIAQRLREFSHAANSLARVGNDEFCLVAEKPATPEKRQALANRLLEAIRTPLPLPEHPLVMTASIGISHYPEHGRNAEDLIAGAELAMDAAHKAGGNTCHLYDPTMGEQSTHRLFLEHDLRRAIANEEFVAWFQLQYSLETQTVSGAEALVRWHQPDRGMVSPGDFIPLAEETGLVTDIDFWVLKTACRQIATWENAGHRMPRIAVNLSTRDLQDERLCPMVRAILDETGIQPNRLELEITETMLMESPQNAVDVMNQLSELGIRLSMDDFGRGYSNLAFLRRLPLDQLKIDMSLIQDIEASERNRSIVRAIVDFAKALDLELVAEGIETSEQLEFLRKHGCDLGQGYFFARPLPAEQVFQADT